MRWQHPHRGLLSPIAFINDLDQLGLITEAGKRAAEQAVDDWASWATAGLFPPTLAVNVAASQLHSDSLVDDLLA
ncbi:EAL domain-containing protein, partial [Streptococcus pyogenes]